MKSTSGVVRMHTMVVLSTRKETTEVDLSEPAAPAEAGR